MNSAMSTPAAKAPLDEIENGFIQLHRGSIEPAGEST
jgi:hypothetical protein